MVEEKSIEQRLKECMEIRQQMRQRKILDVPKQLIERMNEFVQKGVGSSTKIKVNDGKMILTVHLSTTNKSGVNVEL